jgi:hypothetical protein
VFKDAQAQIAERVRASGVFFSLADSVRREVFVIEDFGGNVPSVEVLVFSVARIFLIGGFNNTLTTVHVAGRNVGNNILVVDNSENLLNVGFNGLSEDSVTNSGGTESVEEDVFLGEDSFLGEMEGSNGSESTTETVTSDIEVPTSMGLGSRSHGFHKFTLEVGVIVLEEVFVNLSTGSLAESAVFGLGASEFLGKLNSIGGTTESNNESLAFRDFPSGVRDAVLVRKLVFLVEERLVTG